MFHTLSKVHTHRLARFKRSRRSYRSHRIDQVESADNVGRAAFQQTEGGCLSL